MVSHIQGYSEVRRIPSVIIRKIGYDGVALLMLEFYVFASVLYAVILPVDERGNKLYASDKLDDNYIDNEANNC